MEGGIICLGFFVLLLLSVPFVALGLAISARNRCTQLEEELNRLRSRLLERPPQQKLKPHQAPTLDPVQQPSTPLSVQDSEPLARDVEQALAIDSATVATKEAPEQHPRMNARMLSIEETAQVQAELRAKGYLQDSPERPPRSAPSPTPQAAQSSETLWENFVGLKLLAWVGMGLVFLGVVLFLIWAWNKGYLGKLLIPPVRVSLVALIGLGLVGAGVRFIRNSARPLGETLIGGGIALTYLAIIACFKPRLLLMPEPLLGAVPVFVLMVLTTIGGFFLAIRQNALSAAVIALLGGFAAPVVASTGSGERDVLCIWLMILSAGAILTAFRQRWHALSSIALSGSALLFWCWSISYYNQSLRWGTLTWSLGFLLLFLTPLALHAWRRRHLPPEQACTGMGALTLALIAITVLVSDLRLVHGGILLTLSAFLIALGQIMRRRIPGPDPSWQALTVMAIACATWGLTLVLPMDVRTLGLAIEAVVLVLLGNLYQSRLPKALGIIVLVLTVARILVYDVPFHKPGPDEIHFINTYCLRLMLLPAALAAMALAFAKGEERKEIRLVATLFGFAAVWALPIMLSCEIFRHWHHDETHGFFHVGSRLALLWFCCALAWFLTARFFRPGWIQQFVSRVCVPQTLIASIAALCAYEQLETPPFLNLRLAILFLCVPLWGILLRTLMPILKCRLTIICLTALAFTIETFNQSQELVNYLCLNQNHDANAFLFLCLIWLAAVIAIIISHRKSQSNHLFSRAAEGCLFFALIHGFFANGMKQDSLYAFANLGFYICIAPSALLLLSGRILGRSTLPMAWPGIIAALIIVSTEPWNCCWESSELPRYLLTLVWGLFASGLLAWGLIRNHRSIRIFALLLLGLTTLKILIVDLSGAPGLLRIGAVIATGILFLIGAWGYQRLRKQLRSTPPESLPL